MKEFYNFYRKMLPMMAAVVLCCATFFANSKAHAMNGTFGGGTGVSGSPYIVQDAAGVMSESDIVCFTPRGVERYEVYAGTYADYIGNVNPLLGSFHWLADAVEFVKLQTGALTGSPYTIVLTGENDDDMTNYANTYPSKPFIYAANIPASGGNPAGATGVSTAVRLSGGMNLTLTSDVGNRVIKQLSEGTSGTTGRHLCFYNVDGSITLENIILEGKGLTTGNNICNGGVELYGAGTSSLIMNNGTIIRYCYATTNGGGVALNTNKTFTMNGGSITHNIGNAGGGAHLSGGSKFIMNGGSITYNTSKEQGGGVFHLNGGSTGTFTMNGGSITNNSNGSSGGGVFLSATNISSSSVFNMYGGVIKDNSSGSSGGGGVYVNQYCTFNMLGGAGGVSGTIDHNTTTYSGGGVLVLSSGAFNLEEGKIINNIATYDGGGVHLRPEGVPTSNSSNPTFTMSGGLIDGNTATRGGGGVSVNVYTTSYGGIFTMSGGTISNNTANGATPTYGGGGVFLNITYGSTTSSPAIFTMTGGTITGNKAPNGDGGGIFTAEYDYHNPVDIAPLKYSNIGGATANIMGSARVLNNTASALFSPPGNASVFNTRSTRPFDGQLLDNYQINYRCPTITIGAASSTPTVCINTTLTSITYTTTNATGIGTAINLPTGVAAGWSSNKITISGTPSVPGTFSYKIPVIGDCYTDTARGTITVNSCAVPVSLIVFLEGPTVNDGGTVKMTNYIQDPDLTYNKSAFSEPRLPETDPYGLNTTCTQINNVALTGKVVDWIRVEIWDYTDFLSGTKTVLEKQALLLRPNGEIVDTAGKTPQFSLHDKPVKIVVRHRNHLAVVSDSTFNFTSVPVVYDFSVGLEKALQYDPRFDSKPMEKIQGKYCMWAGDINDDGVVDAYDAGVVATDFNIGSIEDDYRKTDTNMDGIIDAIDDAMTRKAFLQGAVSPISYFD